jgi:hypothetical protein
VSCVTVDNKRKEMLIFEVANFDIEYNYIIGRPFPLKFMAVIYTAYGTMKMPGPKGVIIINVDQHDALACENATLTHVDRFGEKATQEQADKVAKTHDDSTLFKSSAPKPLIIAPPRSPLAKKGTYVAPVSNQPPTDQQADDKKKGVMIRKF